MAGMGMIVAGAMEGWSAGRLDEIKAEREAKMQALADARADKRTQQDQQFRSQEAAIGADRQVAENKRQEGVQAAENEKQRDAQKTTYATDADGNQVMVRGSEATPVTMGGKPLKAATKAGDKPSDQQMVEYLTSDPDFGMSKQEALDWVKTSRGKSSEDSKQALYEKILAAGNMNADDIPAEVEKVWKLYHPETSGKGSVPSDAGHIQDAVPPGAGTEKAPYRADTPNHVAWFKKYAKPGTFIVDPNTGDIYKK